MAMTLPTDPLNALGPSLFLQIISDLPLDSLVTCNRVSRSWHRLITSSTATLYRPLAHSIGVGTRHLRTLLLLERAFAAPSSWAADPEEPEPTSPDEPAASVDWKGIVKAFVVLQSNWKSARGRGKWITPGRNTAWRLKVDKEENTIITTSRLDGILVSDLATSEPLFEYVDVAPYAHLEFAKGFVVFNIGEDHSLEVHLTPSAYRRLPAERRTSIAPSRRSLTHGTAYSFAFNDHYAPRASASGPPPPRGHLTYYRTIRPPTECFAFRSRVDKADALVGEGGDRAVLGTAGAEGAYIFDLEDEERMERYVYPPEQRVRPNYIEFDDNYLFICCTAQVHIYSRQTRRHLSSFPSSSGPDDEASAVYTVDPKADFTRVQRTFEGAVDVGRAEVRGKWVGDEGFEEALKGRSSRDFTACHYTPTDLFATTKSGSLYILRGYPAVLAIEDAARRRAAVKANLMVLAMKEPLLQLATDGEHIAVASSTHVFLLSTPSLPAAPFTTVTPTRPTITLYSLLNIHARGLGQSSSLQMDREHIYATYWALGELQAREGARVRPQGEGEGEEGMPPDDATSDFGLCVKVWDFGLRAGQV